MKWLYQLGLLVTLGSFCCMASSEDLFGGDLYINGYSLQKNNSLSFNGDYTLLDAANYHKTVVAAQQGAQTMLLALEPYRTKTANEQVIEISRLLTGIPYIFVGAMGEGDWQPGATHYMPGAAHIKQDPLYRLDGLNCQTMLQVVMALLYTKSTQLADFEKTILGVSYGAAGNPGQEIVHYYNRNNFPDADFNPINEKNGYLRDITTGSPYSKTVHADITRQNWFDFQIKTPASTVRVLSDAIGPMMVQRLLEVYPHLNYPNFDYQSLTMSYFPKEFIAIKQSDSSYKPNVDFLNSVPTPAVMEVVRDPKLWMIGGKPIREVIGSDLTISHMGLLTRQIFNRGDVIYQKTTCQLDSQQQKVCKVQPVTCTANTCNELMFTHATDALPNGYSWYKQDDGSYACTEIKPAAGPYTSCNRITSVPLFDYLTDYQYGSYWYMDSPSIVGIHIELLASPN